LRGEGVRLDRAPESAVKDVIDSLRPPEDDRHTRQRGDPTHKKLRGDIAPNSAPIKNKTIQNSQ